MANEMGSLQRSNYSKPFAGSGNGGGNVEDTSRRLDKVETNVSELKPQVAAILGMIPHLATKADVADLKADLKTDTAVMKVDLKADIAFMKADLAVIPYLATKAEVADLKADLKADIAAVQTNVVKMESAIIKWIIATVLTSTTVASTVAFTIAKFVH